MRPRYSSKGLPGRTMVETRKPPLLPVTTPGKTADTAGKERFRTITGTASYYRGARASHSCTMCRIENRSRRPRWLEKLENYVPPEVMLIVVGNMLDKEYSRQVPTSEGAAFAARTGCLFVEASAKTALGVTEAFNRGRPAATNAAAASGPPRRDTAESMPGNIDLSQRRTRTHWQGVCVSSAEVIFS
ncbi:ras family-domain-containing protein [Russula aff. rugulosa BPL654]|nr:ras family-domain-containing protein [Russula aff. rugulosa BPL654]